MLTLQDGEARRGWAVVAGLGDDEVLLQTAEGPRTVGLPALARVWRGEFATLWRAPEAWREGASLASMEGWLVPRLDAVQGIDASGDLPARVLAFQTAQGLRPDGRVGPLTLMTLSRAAGEPGPRLRVLP